MSSTTPNLGLTKTTAAETIGQNWAASNDSGGNFDIIDTKMGAVGNTSVQAQLDALNSKLGNYLRFGSINATIEDTTFGFIDSGVSSIDYVILAAYTLLAANNVVLVSNLNTGTANYRFQLMNATNQNILKSGTFRVYYVYIERSKLGS